MRGLLIIISILAGLQIFCQDFIYLINGEEIKAKVLEIDDTKVKYKKYTNQSGPTYSKNKSDIFLIKYQSGDKDVFNAAPSETIEYNKSSAPANKKNGVIGEIGTQNCQPQKQTGAKIYGNKAGDVFFREDLVFYGYDFTYLRLTNHRKLGQSMRIIQENFNEWNILMNKNVGLGELKKWMRKPYMFAGTPIFPNYYKRDFNNFVESGNFCISFDDLQKIINSYELNEARGIGMVINLVNFNKDGEYAMQWVTFFDIESREILYAVLTTGESSGAGMVGHWAVGVENGVRNIFIDEIYKRELYNTMMIPSKLRLY